MKEDGAKMVTSAWVAQSAGQSLALTSKVVQKEKALQLEIKSKLWKHALAACDEKHGI